MIRFSCSKCYTTLQAPDEAAGSIINCTGCYALVQVPGPPPVPPNFLSPAETEPILDAEPATGFGPSAPTGFVDPFANIQAPVPGSPSNFEEYDDADSVTVPEELEADVAKLGRLIRYHGVNLFSGPSVAAFCFCGFGLLMLLFSIGNFARGSRSGFGFLAIAVPCFLFGSLFLLPLLLSGLKRVIVYERGFVYLSMRDARVYRWEDVDQGHHYHEIRKRIGQFGQELGTSHQHNFTLWMKDGTALDFNNHLKYITLFITRVRSELDRLHPGQR